MKFLQNARNALLRSRKKWMISAVVTLMAFTSWGQTSIFSNPITGTNPNTSNPYTTGQVVNDYLSATGIGRGSGISSSNANNRYNASGWTTSGSLNSNDYFTFTITPNPGYKVSFSSFVYTGQASGTGPSSFSFRHSSNFNTNIGSASATGTTISLTGAPYQNLSTLSEFRLYGWNADASGGTFSVNDFTFNGTVLGTSVTALSGFLSCSGTAGTAQSFVVNGNGLNPANKTITVNASAGFEVSITSAVAGFNGSSVSFDAAGGDVSQTVWVRVKSSASPGNLNEFISVSDGDFTGLGVTVTGMVNASPSALNINPATAEFCLGGSEELTGSGTTTQISQVNHHGFEAISPYTLTNGSPHTSGSEFTIRNSPYNVALVSNFESPDDSPMALAVNASFGNANANTSLTSPAIDVSQYSALSLTYRHTYKQGNSGSGTVLVSTDGGTVWAPLITYNSNQGGGENFVPETINLDAYAGVADLRVRFTFISSVTFNSAWWGISEATFSGVGVPLFAWTANTGVAGGLPLNAENFLASNDQITVSPTQSTLYTLLVKDGGTGCETSLTDGASITVNFDGTLALTSGGGTDAQTVCINSPITNITYAVGGGATGAELSVDNLPDGVTGSYNSGVFTISGTPTESGSFNYTVITTGSDCVNPSLGGTIDVTADGTIALTSAGGTDAQTVCINTAIADITYAIGGTSTGANLSVDNLPDGVTGSFNAGVFTISGTPTESGSFNYTVSATGSACVNPSLGGTIEVTADGTITLTSAGGTDAQTVCINTAITDITYAIGGTSTGATLSVDNLPDGVTGSFNAGVFTISGTPTESGSFNYTVSATGSDCVNPSLGGTIDVTADGTIALTSAGGTDAQTVCINTAIADITYAIGGTSTGATLSVDNLPDGVTGSFNAGVFTISGTPTESGSFNYTVSATGSACVNPSLGGTITVDPEGVVGMISGETNVCAHVAPGGVPAMYSVTASDPNASYNWILPVGTTIHSGQGTNTINCTFPVGFINGVVSVDVTSTCGAPVNRTLNVSSATPAVPAVIVGPKNVCPYIGQPDQVAYSVDPVPGAISYEWIVPPSCTLVSGQGTTSILLTVGANFQSLADKMVRVRVLSGCGNSAWKIFHLLAQFPTTPGPITGITDVCPVINTPTEVEYSINKVIAATSYVWTTPAGTTVTHPNGPGENDTIIRVTFDNAFVTAPISVISVNQCTTSGSSRSIMVYRKNPPVPGLITGPTNTCEFILPGGQQAYYTIRKIGVATSYTWTAPVGATIVHENAPGDNDTAVYVTYPAGFVSGQMKVKTHNGCGSSTDRSLGLTKLVVGTPSPIDVAATGNCPNRVFTYSLAAIPTNATSVMWNVPAGGNIISGQGTASIQVGYTGGPIQGEVTVQGFSNCAQSVLRKVAIKLPACPPEMRTTATDVQHGAWEVKLSPNPSAHAFLLELQSADKSAAVVKVMDEAGRVLETHKVASGRLLRFGAYLRAGTYFVEVQQGDNRRVVKAVKM